MTAAEEVTRTESNATGRGADSHQVWARRVRYHLWILATALLVLCVALLLIVPDQGLTSFPLIGEIPPLCLWKRLLNVDCPGCGLTRSFAALAHGHWLAAWSFNPAGWMFFAVCLYQLPYRGWQLWRLFHGRAEYEHRSRTIAIVVWTLLAALLAQWIWKML